MAIVVDAARADVQVLCANEAYQKGNDDANTPTPTWADGFATAAGTAETAIPSPSVDPAPVNNTADLWPPLVVYAGFWLDSTPNTARF